MSRETERRNGGGVGVGLLWGGGEGEALMRVVRGGGKGRIVGGPGSLGCGLASVVKRNMNSSLLFTVGSIHANTLSRNAVWSILGFSAQREFVNS